MVKSALAMVPFSLRKGMMFSSVASLRSSAGVPRGAIPFRIDTNIHYEASSHETELIYYSRVNCFLSSLKPSAIRTGIFIVGSSVWHSIFTSPPLGKGNEQRHITYPYFHLSCFPTLRCLLLHFSFSSLFISDCWLSEGGSAVLTSL